ncbi:hypothetical protein ACNAT8_19195 [Klebsiella quasipneumoniae]|nr:MULTISPECIES: hypothetical protein [Klebsiella]MCF8599762.1 hypothetical protein [Klebsiella sp. 2019SCSN059]MDZ1464886.1 hypothetical protein [Klebsiella quasipneumoniae]
MTISLLLLFFRHLNKAAAESGFSTHSGKNQDNRRQSLAGGGRQSD